MASIHALRHVPLFADVPDVELAPLAPSLVRRSFAKDVLIFSEGSPGSALYVIESGQVRIFLTSSNGQQISLSIYGPGQVFGEISLLDGLPRSASAVALEPVIALALERDDFLPYMDAHPLVARSVIRVLSVRLRHTTAFAESLVFLDVPARLAARLLELAAWRSEAEGSAQISMTQGDLATWVGASRESVNKALSDFRKQGLISIDGQHITIVNQRGLQQKVFSTL